MWDNRARKTDSIHLHSVKDDRSSEQCLWHERKQLLIPPYRKIQLRALFPRYKEG
jgi:hypothetical protein